MWTPTAPVARPRAADARRAAGEHAPLLGVPMAHKDIFVTRRAHHRRLEDARRLPQPLRRHRGGAPGAAGAVSAGQAQLRRVRHGLGQRELGLRPGAQPLGPGARAGRLVGRLAAAVAARLLPAATGTDTGGSIRQPASFTGITGIKPTYGVLALRHDRLRLQPRPGRPDGAQAEDCALLLSAMSGFDERDATSAQRPPQDFHAQMRAPRTAPAPPAARACASACPKSSSPPRWRPT
jgi:aspartyl-tRNA(Asn)/glutamyl-tRNA(Gln) amidotransferase subunit A